MGRASASAARPQLPPFRAGLFPTERRTWSGTSRFLTPTVYPTDEKMRQTVAGTGATFRFAAHDALQRPGLPARRSRHRRQADILGRQSLHAHRLDLFHRAKPRGIPWNMTVRSHDPLRRRRQRPAPRHPRARPVAARRRQHAVAAARRFRRRRDQGRAAGGRSAARLARRRQVAALEDLLRATSARSCSTCATDAAKDALLRLVADRRRVHRELPARHAGGDGARRPTCCTRPTRI